MVGRHTTNPLRQSLFWHRTGGRSLGIYTTVVLVLYTILFRVCAATHLATHFEYTNLAFWGSLNACKVSVYQYARPITACKMSYRSKKEAALLIAIRVDIM